MWVLSHLTVKTTASVARELRPARFGSRHVLALASALAAALFACFIPAPGGSALAAGENGEHAATPVCEAPIASGEEQVVECPFTGTTKSFVVPSGVTSLTLEVKGAEGGSGGGLTLGGEGGESSGTLAVEGGEVLSVLTGGEGEASEGGTPGEGGYGGGGRGGQGSGGELIEGHARFAGGGGGGGGSFVYADGRLVIAAGGGGGATVEGYPDKSAAGAGGGLEGSGAAEGTAVAAASGGGGTQLRGGAPGENELEETNDSGGNGPATFTSGVPVPGDGGHGGAVQAGFETWGGGGGGGGSGYLAPSLTNAFTTRGGGQGNGSVKLVYELMPPSATILLPRLGDVYLEGESVSTSFTCTEDEGGPGLASCLDSNGSSSPGKLNTATPGKHTYVVTATSKDGEKGTAEIEYTVTGRKVTPVYELTVSKSGTGTGTVTSSPAGIECGTRCSADFAEGTVVRLSAPAAAGSTFEGWSGAGCSGTSTCEVKLTGSESVTATFDEIGPTGPTAPTGTTGMTGLPGVTGNTGTEGSTGGVGSTGSSGGMGPATKPPAPTCTLAPHGDAVLSGKRRDRASVVAGRLAFGVRCNAIAEVTLSGVLSVSGGRDGHHGVRHFALRPAHASVAADVPATIYLALPPQPLHRLDDGARGSLKISLTATGLDGTAHATLSIVRIVPPEGGHS